MSLTIKAYIDGFYCKGVIGQSQQEQGGQAQGEKQGGITQDTQNTSKVTPGELPDTATQVQAIYTVLVDKSSATIAIALESDDKGTQRNVVTIIPTDPQDHITQTQQPQTSQTEGDPNLGGVNTSTPNPIIMRIRGAINGRRPVGFSLNPPDPTQVTAVIGNRAKQHLKQTGNQLTAIDKIVCTTPEADLALLITFLESINATIETFYQGISNRTLPDGKIETHFSTFIFVSISGNNLLFELKHAKQRENITTGTMEWEQSQNIHGDVHIV